MQSSHEKVACMLVWRWFWRKLST